MPLVKYGVRFQNFIWAPVHVKLYSLAETPQPPPPPHLGSYTRALFVSQDRRHLFVTLCTYIPPFYLPSALSLSSIFSDPASSPPPFISLSLFFLSLFFVYFFGGLVCVVFLKDDWIPTQRAAVASRCATNLATHLFET
jgi:hypothetical protein